MFKSIVVVSVSVAVVSVVDDVFCCVVVCGIVSSVVSVASSSVVVVVGVVACVVDGVLRDLIVVSFLVILGEDVDDFVRDFVVVVVSFVVVGSFVVFAFCFSVISANKLTSNSFSLSGVSFCSMAIF